VCNPHRHKMLNRHNGTPGTSQYIECEVTPAMCMRNHWLPAAVSQLLWAEWYRSCSGSNRSSCSSSSSSSRRIYLACAKMIDCAPQQPVPVVLCSRSVMDTMTVECGVEGTEKTGNFNSSVGSFAWPCVVSAMSSCSSDA
jgi:hypothetical protein